MVSVGDTSGAWEIVDLEAVRQGASCSRLLYPLLRFPPPLLPIQFSWTFSIVWEVPGRPDWGGVHFSWGSLGGDQIKLHAAAALPHLSPADAIDRIRWVEAIKFTHAQLRAAYIQGAGLPVETPVRYTGGATSAHLGNYHEPSL